MDNTTFLKHNVTGSIEQLKSAAARGVSVVFHPGFQQFYLILYLGVVQHRLLSVLPAAALFILGWPTAFYLIYKKKILKDDSLFRMERRDRFWPILANISGLVLFTFVQWTVDHWLGALPEGQSFLAGFAPIPGEPLSLYSLCLLLIMLNLISISITFLYKISLHMLATASVTFVYFLPEVFWLTGLIAIGMLSLVGWSRLYLRGHTRDQVIVGTATGLLYAAAIVTYMGGEVRLS